MLTNNDAQSRRAALKCVLAGLMAICLSGCGTTSFDSKAGDYKGSSPVTSLYIYSFLDLREDRLGKKFLAEVQRQLPIALAKEGLNSKQFWFNASPLKAQFALEATRTGPSTSGRVPVNEIVKANQQDEVEFGASHRLVAFPSFVVSSGSGSRFTVQWDLVDTRTNIMNWTTVSSSNFENWLLQDENSDERAKTFVMALITELKAAKAIKQ